MTPTYVAWLGLEVRFTNVDIQKIDGLALKTYKKVIAGLLVYNKLGRIQFFEKTFLLADINIEVVLEIPFLSLSNIDVEFMETEELT